jgi:hypothetical protein
MIGGDDVHFVLVLFGFCCLQYTAAPLKIAVGYSNLVSFLRLTQTRLPFVFFAPIFFPFPISVPLPSCENYKEFLRHGCPTSVTLFRSLSCESDPPLFVSKNTLKSFPPVILRSSLRALRFFPLYLFLQNGEL